MNLPTSHAKALGYVIGKPVGVSLPAGYTHPYALDIEACPDQECWICGTKACPHGEPFHFHHDGCPACSYDTTSPLFDPDAYERATHARMSRI